PQFQRLLGNADVHGPPDQHGRQRRMHWVSMPFERHLVPLPRFHNRRQSKHRPDDDGSWAVPPKRTSRGRRVLPELSRMRRCGEHRMDGAAAMMPGPRRTGIAAVAAALLAWLAVPLSAQAPTTPTAA